MDDGRSELLFRSGARRRRAGNAGKPAVAYAPQVPGWTRHGLWLLLVLAALLLAASTLPGSADHERVSAVIDVHDGIAVARLTTPLPSRVVLQPGTEVDYLGDRQAVAVRLRLGERIDAGDAAADRALLRFNITVVEGGPVLHAPDAQGGVLIVPVGRISLWQQLRRWL